MALVTALLLLGRPAACIAQRELRINRRRQMAAWLTIKLCVRARRLISLPAGEMLWPVGEWNDHNSGNSALSRPGMKPVKLRRR